MKTRTLTPPAIAAMAIMIVGTATPRAGLAQPCRRSCEVSESRDVRGCCIPGAAPKPDRPQPKPARKPERPPRKEPPPPIQPEPNAPTASPARPPSKPAPEEPPAATEKDRPQRVRQQREPAPAPGEPTRSEPAPAKPIRNESPPSTPSHSEPAGSTPDHPPAASPRPAPRAPASVRPAVNQPPRAEQGAGNPAPGNVRAEPPALPQTKAIDLPSPQTEPPPASRPIQPEAGPATQAPGMLASPQEALQTPDRRWPVWMPWAVVGTGAVMTGAGGLLYTSASSKYASFDAQFDEYCPPPSGCVGIQIPSSLTRQLHRARSLETSSRISFIAGGTTLAVGAMLILLNRTTEFRNESVARIFVVPIVNQAEAGIAASMSF